MRPSYFIFIAVVAFCLIQCAQAALEIPPLAKEPPGKNDKNDPAPAPAPSQDPPKNPPQQPVQPAKPPQDNKNNNDPPGGDNKPPVNQPDKPDNNNNEGKPPGNAPEKPDAKPAQGPQKGPELPNPIATLIPTTLLKPSPTAPAKPATSDFAFTLSSLPPFTVSAKTAAFTPGSAPMGGLIPGTAACKHYMINCRDVVCAFQQYEASCDGSGIGHCTCHGSNGGNGGRIFDVGVAFSLAGVGILLGTL
ncbi:uncharacterized protein VTP21DRAFT_4757 [Calcarisporiella thermophila]|uniref:uncharacterized protein n=1 Tax=Calcarisporiella thermophila TaxID=911321 RepID=UPI0037425E15